MVVILVPIRGVSLMGLWITIASRALYPLAVDACFCCPRLSLPLRSLTLQLLARGGTVVSYRAQRSADDPLAQS